MSVDEQLKREAAGRRVAAGAAIGAVLLPLAAQVIFQTLAGAGSSSSPGAVLDQPAFYSDNAPALILAAVLVAVGYVLTGVALARLYQATRFRRPQTPGVARVMAYAGPAALALAVVGFQVVVTVASADYLAAGRDDYFAARAVGNSTPALIAGVLNQVGILALAFAFVLISLNAMRAGLLTRFIGILGVIAGVLLVIPQLAPLPIVHWFWLGALACLFLGRWPGGPPAAWRTGEAEPWPTTQELRERRDAARQEAADDEVEAPAATVEAHPTQRPRASSRKRKGRKRR